MELMRLPLGYGWAFGDGPPYFPMARAIVGGLLCSTFVSLVLLPMLYTWLDIMRHWSAALGRAVLHRLEALWNRTTGIPITFP
jgi:hydrophobic/amphiphilic exporter-1 (mainly G- bacteria), HAE1 family